MARNIGTRKMVQVSGLKEMQDNISRLITRMDGQEMQRDLGDLAIKGARMLEAEAQSQHWPKDAIDSIFVYSKLDPKESRRRKGPAALFGFRKRGRSQPYASGYREWFPGRSKSMRLKQLVRVGARTDKGTLQKIGESLATMFEFGTSKMRARPAMRTVIQRMRAIYVPEVGAILQRIFAQHARTQSGTK